MFNKSYNQVSAECASLNRKLRRHISGKLNAPARVVQSQVNTSAEEQTFPWNNVMICAAIIAIYFLIKGLFTR